MKTSAIKADSAAKTAACNIASNKTLFSTAGDKEKNDVLRPALPNIYLNGWCKEFYFIP